MSCIKMSAGRSNLLKTKLSSIVASVVFVLSQNAVADSQPLDIHISSKASVDALVELADKTGLEIIVPQQLGKNVVSPEVNGSVTAEQALMALLVGTGLTHEYISDNMVVVKKYAPGEVSGKENQEQDSSSFQMEEITVTATKRETKLQDTAAAITVLGADVIEKRGLVKMDDYLSSIAGVVMMDRGAEGSGISMRGISSDPQRERAAVGVYFDGVPLDGTIGWSGGFGDFRMVDIERVEVLKGPQGTLFGAGSMGGAVRIIPKLPDLTVFEGSVKAGYSATGLAGGDNNQLEGVVNIPLIENNLAIRGVVYRVKNSGYVDNIAGSHTGDVEIRSVVEQWGGSVIDEGNRGANETQGIRISALWQPVEDLSVRLSHTRQKTEQDGSLEIDLRLPGDYQQVRARPELIVVGYNGYSTAPEASLSELSYTRLDVDYDVGLGNLVSSSSWLDYEGYRIGDSTYRRVFGTYFGTYPRLGDRFTQELRFASSFDGPVQLLVGGFYQKDKVKRYGLEGFSGDPDLATDFFVQYTGLSEAPAVPANAPDDFFWSLDLSGESSVPEVQKAIFGELSWDIVDDLTLTLGARSYEYDQSSTTYYRGGWIRKATLVKYSDLSASVRGNTYKTNLSWKPSENTLLYAQWAQGFRPGKPLGVKQPIQNFDPEGTGFYTGVNGAKYPILDHTKPDETDNYEIGFKGSFFDQRLTLNLTAYQIDWRGLPVSLQTFEVDDNGEFTVPSGSTTVNVGKALSKGFEMEVSTLLTDYLALNLATSYNTTEIAETQANLGEKGTKLPGSADFSLSGGLEYGFLIQGYDSYIRADYNHLSTFEGTLNQPDSAPKLGGYHQIHMRGGINFGNVDLEIFVRNLTNSKALASEGNSTRNSGYNSYLRLRPRIIGLNMSYHF